MLSAFGGRGEDRTQYLSACSPTLYPLSYPARQFAGRCAIAIRQRLFLQRLFGLCTVLWSSNERRCDCMKLSEKRKRKRKEMK
jgi:hypothetical protein